MKTLLGVGAIVRYLEIYPGNLECLEFTVVSLSYFEVTFYCC